MIETEKKSNLLRSVRYIGKFSLIGLLFVLAFIMTSWAVAAIYFSNLPTVPARMTGSIIFVILVIASFVFIRPLKRSFLLFIALFCIVLILWFMIPPSNDRQWHPDGKILCNALIKDEEITIHNIRNFDYKSPTDYTVGYYDKTFTLSKLQTVDLFLSFWGPTKIAHTLMSFGFGEEGYVCISIETRKEIGEEYSTVKGFFRQFELIYIVADERDLVRLRTNYRNEDVYLYRLNVEREIIRSVFMDYFKRINRLNQKPEWYNALTQNCTSTIRGHSRPYTHAKWDWRLLLNGYLDEKIYEQYIDSDLTFKEFQERSHINQKAGNTDSALDFSRRIRVGLPGMNSHSLE